MTTPESRSRSRQLHDRVVGAPDLEGARQLEVLGLERDDAAGEAADRSRGEHRGDPRDALEAIAGSDDVRQHRPRHRHDVASRKHRRCNPVGGGQRIDLAPLHRGDELRERRVLRDRALDLATGTRGRGRDHLAGEVAAPALLELSVGGERIAPLDDRAPQPVDSLATKSLGEDDRRPPGRVGIEGDHSTNVVLQGLRPRLIHLVDRDHVGDLHDPGLQRLHRVARARHQDEHDLVGDAHHLDLALPRSDGLEEDDVRPGGVEQQEGLQRGLGQPAEMPTGAHRADEHSRVEEVIGEPDPVAEQRSPREGARRVDRDHPHRQVERANVRDQRADQRRLADAGRPRDPDREGRAGRRIQLLEHGQGARGSALDQRDRPRDGSPVAGSHAGDELVVSPRAAGHRRHSTARARPFWTADAVRRRL